jgi:hypothetical protein
VFSYKQKAFALSTGIDKAQRKLSKSLFKSKLDILDHIELTKQFDDKYGYLSYKLGYSLNQSRYKRKQRVQERIKSYVLSGAYFLTLTFTNEVLNSTSEDTRRQYVRRWLKSFSNNYIANIDYGDKTEREHYHCVIQQHDQITTWQYGFMNKKIIRTENNSLERISKYISKLTNHSLKNSGKLKRIIYSKKL